MEINSACLKTKIIFIDGSKMTFNIIRFILIPLIFCLLFIEKAKAQNRASDTTFVISDTTNLDALFKKAREYAFDNNYPQARRICQKILEKKPTYYDVRSFLGRIYAWEKQYDNARTELSRVLIERENDYEALSALYDVEFWTESYSVANDYLKIALGYYPTSEALLIKKARLQIKLEEKSEAALTLRRILDLNPGQKEAINLMNSLEGRKLSNNFQTSLLVDLFANRNPRQLFSAELGRNLFFGSLTARFNLADQFNRKGWQYEVESYAHFTHTTYANLLIGFSEVSIFPKFKYIVEIYQKLPAGFECSFGIRHLKFSDVTTIYSGSISNYYKDYYFSVRTFITPRDSIIREVLTKKTSVSVVANIRTYFGDSDNYFGVRAGTGVSPDESAVSLDVAAFLPSYNVGFEFQKNAFGRWLIKTDMTYAKENIISNTVYRKRISTTITLKTVF